jgi:hypothetical protein
MGLFYIMPVATEEVDYVTSLNTNNETQILVKSYGPPLLFWYYLIAIILVIIVMTTAIWHPMMLMIRGEDLINKFIGALVLITLLTTPLVAIAFFYYQKQILRTSTSLTISHHIFGIRAYAKKFDLAATKFTIEHQMDGENYARLSGRQELRAFYNQGHYYFYAEIKNGPKQMIDRNQRKSDLIKLSELLKLSNVQVSSLGMTNPLDA